MKKILLSSAAAFAFAGAAAADVTISGDAELGYNEEIEGGVYWGVGLTVDASAELDNGWTAAGSLDIDFGSGSTFGLGSIDASDWELSLSSDMGGLYFGDTALASDKHWSGVTNMNDDGFAENGDTFEAAVIRGEAIFGGVEIAVSTLLAGPDTIDDAFDEDPPIVLTFVDQELYGMTFGATADLGGVTLVAAYQDTDVTGGEIFGISAAASMGGIDFMVAHANSTDENSSTGVSVSYPMGNVTLGAFFVVEDVEDDNYGVTVDYSEGDVSVDAFFHGGDDEDAGINVTFDAGNGIEIFAGWSDDDGSYVGGTMDLGGGAEILFSWGDDPNDAANDEIGPPEVLTGVNVVLSLSF